MCNPLFDHLVLGVVITVGNMRVQKIHPKTKGVNHVTNTGYPKRLQNNT